eukprot:3170631-Pyramimonas_sp.AAC.1
MNVKTEGPPSAKAPRRPGAAGAASASTASPAGKTAPNRAAEPRPYLTNSGVDAYMDELTEAPSKCGRNDCPNTLAKAGDNEEFRCKEWGGSSGNELAGTFSVHLFPTGPGFPKRRALTDRHSGLWGVSFEGSGSRMSSLKVSECGALGAGKER